MALLTEDLRRLIGTKKVYVSPEAFGGAAGRYYAIATDDDNPLYFDSEYAKSYGLQGVTIPPTLICETNQYANLPRAEDGYAGHVWEIEIPNSRKVRGGNSYEFFRRIRPEDVITATWEIADIEEKQNRSGAGMLIVTSKASYTNQFDELLATNTETIIFVERGDK